MLYVCGERGFINFGDDTIFWMLYVVGWIGQCNRMWKRTNVEWEFNSRGYSCIITSTILYFNWKSRWHNTRLSIICVLRFFSDFVVCASPYESRKAFWKCLLLTFFTNILRDFLRNYKIFDCKETGYATMFFSWIKVLMKSIFYFNIIYMNIVWLKL